VCVFFATILFLCNLCWFSFFFLCMHLYVIFVVLHIMFFVILYYLIMNHYLVCNDKAKINVIMPPLIRYVFSWNILLIFLFVLIIICINQKKKNLKKNVFVWHTYSFHIVLFVRFFFVFFFELFLFFAFGVLVYV